ncbi:MAG: hypothetical protein AB7O96_04550 [Pseudobdellovibrionaceae bacterium]
MNLLLALLLSTSAFADLRRPHPKPNPPNPDNRESLSKDSLVTTLVGKDAEIVMNSIGGRGNAFAESEDGRYRIRCIGPAKPKCGLYFKSSGFADAKPKESTDRVPAAKPPETPETK